jgi:hypothetical protein
MGGEWFDISRTYSVILHFILILVPMQVWFNYVFNLMFKNIDYIIDKENDII